MKNTPAASHEAAGPLCIRIQIRIGAVAIRNSVTIFGGVIGTGLACRRLDELRSGFFVSRFSFFVAIRTFENI